MRLSKQNIIQIWKSKGQILEGIKHSIFQREDVEQIAEERLSICRACPSGCYDNEGTGCMVPGTQPCCNQDKGGCGCSLAFKTRSLSSGCPFHHWEPVLDENEEEALNRKLAL